MGSNEYSDRQLVADIYSGNPEVAGRAADKLKGMCYGAAVRRCSPHMIEDVVQEAMLRIHEGRLSGYDPARSELMSYIGRMVANVGVTLHRREGRYVKGIVRLQELLNIGGAPGRTDSWLAEAQMDAIRQESSDQEFDIVCMVYAREMTVEQVAHHFNLPVGTVKSKIHHLGKRARRRLEKKKEALETGPHKRANSTHPHNTIG